MSPTKDNLVIYVPCYKEGPNDILHLWLGQLRGSGWRWNYGPWASRPAPLARNQIVERFLRGKDEYLVMIDNCVIPLGERTEGLLKEEGDLVYCGRFGRDGSPGNFPFFSMGAWRVRRWVVEEMKPPFFDYVYSTNHRILSSCECQYFVEHLPEGVSPVRVGEVGYPADMISIPLEGDEAKMRLVPRMSLIKFGGGG
jgi:hypothetical protein